MAESCNPCPWKAPLADVRAALEEYRSRPIMKEPRAISVEPQRESVRVTPELVEANRRQMDWQLLHALNGSLPRQSIW